MISCSMYIYKNDFPFAFGNNVSSEETATTTEVTLWPPP